MIIITGVTGHVGRALAARLVAEGQAVRGLTRDPARVELPAGVEPVRADFPRSGGPAELEQLFAGATKLFLNLAGVGNATEDVLAAAERAGVRRVVMLSSGAILDEDAEQQSAIAAWHLAAERAVRATAAEWVMLRPNAFATNSLHYAPQIRAGDLVRAPHGDAVMAPIHEDDIAAVAACALLDDGHHGRVYRLTGPAAITTAEQVEAIGAALGRSLRFTEITAREAAAELYADMPQGIVEAMLGAFAASVGTRPEITTTVRDVTGVPARTFGQWAADHVADFR
ncbi:NAD(P)H-binding protein [Streptomyces poonensis]|uniref:Nucleotide-diphosphate-sugar epimerase n=1 Tax=Streptomyces poonensis TaxID=68255 RepID=A0A918UL39_9ACTN|nr:NAD(P)H-binding protein [Streptomyces poonensis]GGZ17616.1 nucleotide-diphosphate-sugar epimerase [Streptomyces poonensis]GLJ90972.1 nucleotide-diphosphate-sugar epimerase [Streptomyces poonensis]